MTTKQQTKTTAKRPSQRKKTASKNPLYVVTNKGSVVEKVDNLVDLVVKKLNLAPALALFETLVNLLQTQANNYSTFVWLKKQVDRLVSFIESFAPKAKTA